jgi:hypothetical protein
MYVPVQDVQTEYRFPWFISEAFSIGKINCKSVDGDGGFRTAPETCKTNPGVSFFIYLRHMFKLFHKLFQ